MSQRVYDVNGWYEIAKNPLSKAGVFPFKGASIGAPDPNKMYQVYRPPSELGSADTIASARLIPWVSRHAMLSGNTQTTSSDATGYVPPEQKGIGGVTGQNIAFDQNTNTLYGNLKCFSNSLNNEVDNSGIKDLSMGYRCQYDMTPGITPEGESYDCVQRNIRFNHNASVPQGRMGPSVAVLDGTDQIETSTLNIAEFHKMTAKIKTKAVDAMLSCFPRVKNGKIVMPSKDAIAGFDAAEAEPDAESATLPDMSISDVVAMIKGLAPQISELVGALQSMGSAPADPAAGNPDDTALDKKPGAAPPHDPTAPPAVPPASPAAPAMDNNTNMDKKPVGMDAAEIDRRIQAGIDARMKSVTPHAILSEINQRNELATKLSEYVGSFDHAEMTLGDVAKYGVAKLKIPGVVAGQEIGAVNAYLFGRTPSYKTGGDAIAVTSTSVDAYLYPAKGK